MQIKATRTHSNNIIKISTAQTKQKMIEILKRILHK